MNRVDRAIAEANDAVDRVTNRELERDIAWAHLGWIQHQNAGKQLRRQRATRVFHGAIYAVLVATIFLWLLVWLRP